MEAMVMTFQMRQSQRVEGLAAGVNIEFTISADRDESYADDIRVHPFKARNSTRRKPDTSN